MKPKHKSSKPEEKPLEKVFSVGWVVPEDRPFAALLHLKETTPSDSTHSESSNPTPPTTAPSSRHWIDLAGQTAIVMRSSKGHHGKTVTLISNLNLSHSNAGKLLHLFKSRMGVRGSVEEVEGDPVLLLQGDVRDRVELELKKLHAKVKRAGG